MYKHTQADMHAHAGPANAKNHNEGKEDQRIKGAEEVFIKQRLYIRRTIKGRVCVRMCVKKRSMRQSDSGGQTLIPPGACWVSLQ